jgi:hypothetical protein
MPTSATNGTNVVSAKASAKNGNLDPKAVPLAMDYAGWQSEVEALFPGEWAPSAVINPGQYLY